MLYASALLLLVANFAAAAAAAGMADFYAQVGGRAGSSGERWVFWHGVAAKELAAVEVIDGVRQGAVLRQMSDGVHLMQMIYDPNERLVDCEFLSDPEMVASFEHKFQDDYDAMLQPTPAAPVAANTTTTTFLHLKNATSELDQVTLAMLDYKRLKKLCARLHRGMRIKAAEVKGQHSLQRRRRDVDDLLRVPHTKFCGKGSRSEMVEHLGGFAAADRCCRQHDDRCPHYILAFEDKYELFNGRPYTAMHCTCDDRFRSCLKQANTGASDFVGKLFFNIIQTKCFVLKAEKVCKKNSWWGNCQQAEWKKKAHLRDPIPY